MEDVLEIRPRLMVLIAPGKWAKATHLNIHDSEHVVSFLERMAYA